MLSKAERDQANHHLKKHGFGGLDDRNILDQLALMVRDHKHFRSVLMTTNPLERKACYDSLAPRLMFKAKPLEDYIAEAKLDAEIRQLPNYDPKTLQVTPFEVPEIRTKPDITPEVVKLAEKAEEAIKTEDESQAWTGSLELVCTRCTFSDVIPGRNSYMASVNADVRGWTSPRKGTVYCPDCSKMREEGN